MLRRCFPLQTGEIPDLVGSTSSANFLQVLEFSGCLDIQWHTQGELGGEPLPTSLHVAFVCLPVVAAKISSAASLYTFLEIRRHFVLGERVSYVSRFLEVFRLKARFTLQSFL